jgi:predicted metal-binding protein
VFRNQQARPLALAFLAIPSLNLDRPMTATLHVCTTCKAGEVVEDGQALPGARLHAALLAGEIPEGLRIVGVPCLSACNSGAAVALSAPGRWSYVYGRLTEADAPDILLGAAAYLDATDGIVPWRARPVIFRKQSLARIPPLELPDV